MLPIEIDNNMKNISKTITTTTSISLLAIALTFVMATPAYAHDSNSSILTFYPFSAASSETIWYDDNALDNVTYNGSEDNSVALRLIAEVPRNTVDQTDFDLTEVGTNNQAYNSRVDAKYFTSTNDLGLTQAYSGAGGLYKVLWLNTNDNLNYKTSIGCNLSYGEVNPDYILTHEMGHVAGLAHHTWHWGAWGGHTAMEDGCHSDFSQLQTEDIADINGYYT